VPSRRCPSHEVGRAQQELRRGQRRRLVLGPEMETSGRKLRSQPLDVELA
jgi:hypothetical protein